MSSPDNSQNSTLHIKFRPTLEHCCVSDHKHSNWVFFFSVLPSLYVLFVSAASWDEQADQALNEDSSLLSLCDSGVIDLLNFTERTESDLDLGVLALVATLNVLTEAGWIINLRKGHFAWAHKNELADNVCVRGARASVFVATLTFTWNPIWKWEGAAGNADYREHSLCLLYNWLAVTHFIAIKQSPGHFLNYAETHSAEQKVNSCHLIILDYTV